MPKLRLDPEKAKKMSIYLSKDLYERINCFADSHGYSSLAKLIRDAVEDFIGDSKLEMSVRAHFALGIYDSLKEAIDAGKDIIIEDSKTKERIKLLVPRCG